MDDASRESGWLATGAASVAPPLSSLPGPTTADVVVVGLGASGLTACQRLAERGADVIGLDASAVAAGAAGRNGGFLLAGGSRFHHDAIRAWGHDRALMLYRASLLELERTVEQLRAVGGAEAVQRDGSLRIAADADELADCQEHLAALQADGIAAEPYEGLEGTGLLVHGDATFHPLLRAHTLASAAHAAGARLHAPTTVTGLAEGQVATTQGTIRAPSVIVAVDGGLERVLPELAPAVRTARLQMLATAPVGGGRLPRPVYSRWGYDYAHQRPDGRILLGGCRDRHLAQEWDARAVVTDAVQACLDAQLRALGIEAPVTHRWAALAAFTTDGWPICAQVRPGVFAVGAHSGHGNLIGTLAARRAADAALDGTPLRLV